MTKVSVDVAALSAEQKLDLIDELWMSLDVDDLSLTPEQRAELDRRLDRIEREGVSGTPWEWVRSEMTSPTR